MPYDNPPHLTLNFYITKKASRKFGVDSDTAGIKYLILKLFNVSDNIPFIWTGGRKCNFEGCERSDLQPG